MSKLFRKSALEHFSTPEQLNQQTEIVKPFYWLGISAFALLIVSIIVWGFYGNINSTISLQGIVFPKSGVTSIVTNCSGMVQDVLYEIGDSVKKGDIIAVVPDENILEQMDNIRFKLEKADSLQKSKWEKQLKELYVSYEQNSIIRSTQDGIIQNIINVGQVLKTGDTIVTILVNSQYSNNRQVVAYVPLKVAKRLQIGMEAQICPSYVSREEYGYMKGYISAIGKIPVTDTSLEKYYGSLAYVSDILPSESCVEILIAVQVDETSANFFEWSNKKGKDLSVEVGTICNIQTVIQSSKPIHLLY